MSTIKDVAKYAGVSTATVSRVINHAPNVRPETVARVNEAIAACHFVPNFVARNLKSEQTKTIGFLVSDIANSYFTIMAKALEIKLQKLGYDMMVCSTDDDPSMEKSYLTQFQSNRVAGIVLNTTGKNTEFIETLSQSIPMVLVETVSILGQIPRGFYRRGQPGRNVQPGPVTFWSGGTGGLPLSTETWKSAREKSGMKALCLP